MIRRRILTVFAVILIAASALVGVSWQGTASAAQTSTVGAGNAMKVSPVRTDVTMDPGTTKVIDVFITNLTSVPASLHAAINDFTTDNERGQPAILLDEEQYAPSHSFKQYAQPIPNFQLAAGATKDVKVTITIPKGSAGGGYYGAVRFLPAASVGEKNINLAASIGSLVLLRVNGNVVEKLKIASFDIRRGDNAAFFFTSNKGLTAVARFQNTGNIQEEPFGKLELKRFGKLVGTYEVNTTDPKGNVLPDSIRRFDTPLKGLNSFGKFTLEGNFGYGPDGQLLIAKTTFYVVPVALAVIILLALLLLIILIIVLPRLVRNYNRRVIRRASRRR